MHIVWGGGGTTTSTAVPMMEEEDDIAAVVRDGEPSPDGTFVCYMEQLLSSTLAFFGAWDFDRIELDEKQWNTRIRWLAVYLLANHHPEVAFRTQTHVGCVQSKDIARRMQQHMGIIPGCPAETRKALGHWKLLAFIVMPPIRNFSTKDIKERIRKGRGGASRLSRALDVAIENGYIWRVTRDVSNTESPYYMPDICQFLSRLSTPAEHLWIEEVDEEQGQPPAHAPVSRKRKNVPQGTDA